jgi:hypothetical protein
MGRVLFGDDGASTQQHTVITVARGPHRAAASSRAGNMNAGSCQQRRLRDARCFGHEKFRIRRRSFRRSAANTAQRTRFSPAFDLLLQ